MKKILKLLSNGKCIKNALFFVILFSSVFSCRIKNFPYEGSDFYKGKSYVVMLKSYKTYLTDSTEISGRVFVKKRHNFKVHPYTKLELISEANDTIRFTSSYYDGFQKKFASGIYKLRVITYDCVNIEIPGLEFKPNTLYLFEFLLQKGQGLSKWYIS